MRGAALIACVALAGCARIVAAQQSATTAPPVPTEQPAPASTAAAQQAPAAAPAAAGEQRLVFSGDGASLSQNHGGGGGSLNWLGSSAAGDVIGLGAEYQTIANSHWTNAVFNGALALGQTAPKATLYAEAHEGAGDIGEHAFHYSVIDGGLVGTLTPWFSVQLEERYIDIDTSHGNLPKLGLLLHPTPALLASVSYAYTFGGNLGTRLWTGRLDYVGRSFTWLAGVARGPVAPAVLNLFGQVLRPGATLSEGFAGIGKRFGRAEWQLLGDYQDLEGYKRTTVTLSCTVHLGRGS